MVNDFSAEFLDAEGIWPAECVDMLRTEGTIRSPLGVFPYASVLLSGEGLVDSYDRNSLLSSNGIASLIFPRIDADTAVHTTRFMTLVRGGEITPPEYSPYETRRALLGLTVGEVALGRYRLNNDLPSIVRRAQDSGIAPRNLAQVIYSALDIPLAVVDMYNVARHEEAEVGSRAAVLYVPADVHPRLGLRWMRETVQSLNDSESKERQALSPHSQQHA